jgi:hypothetical protein
MEKAFLIRKEAVFRSSTRRMIDLSIIALGFRNDCLKFAKSDDIGDKLRSDFREDAAYWAELPKR